MSLTVEQTLAWLTKFNEDVQANKDYLSELDTPIGDGDHGGNMARGMESVMGALSNQTFTQVSDVFKVVAMTLLSKVGGASGPLYASAFMGMMKTAMTSTEKVDLVKSGLEAIQNRGKAEVGEKTMVDIWSAVANDLSNNDASVEKIKEYVQNSKDIVATKGRASYVGERSLGHIDPGSQSSGYLLSRLLEI